ncbi:MAG: 5'/3'-nucleotidase SurE [Clostridia bacterium]|nr:5'/3'-nucleotidase SurE [Clostridia bacterium]MBR0326902.1 5'/3'-nucleotidase SurE [Clostridia bacterium]
MRILITNDDGRYAEQLFPLIDFCKSLGDVFVCVPKFEQSGKSHGIELHKPFEAKREEIDGITVWTVDSTPADCVRFAVLGLKEKFDLVISGINRGLNLGIDMLYSGTVSATCEAAILGIKAIALSVSPEDYNEATKNLKTVFDYILSNDLLSKHTLYNVNMPNSPKGILITHQGGPYYSDDFVHIGNDMYTPVGKCVYEDRNDLTIDTDAVMHGYISIMPLTIDKTCKIAYNNLRK